MGDGTFNATGGDFDSEEDGYGEEVLFTDFDDPRDFAFGLPPSPLDKHIDKIDEWRKAHYPHKNLYQVLMGLDPDSKHIMGEWIADVLKGESLTYYDPRHAIPNRDGVDITDYDHFEFSDVPEPTELTPIGNVSVSEIAMSLVKYTDSPYTNHYTLTLKPHRVLGRIIATFKRGNGTFIYLVKLGDTK